MSVLCPPPQHSTSPAPLNARRKKMTDTPTDTLSLSKIIIAPIPEELSNSMVNEYQKFQVGA